MENIERGSLTTCYTPLYIYVYIIECQTHVRSDPI